MVRLYGNILVCAVFSIGAMGACKKETPPAPAVVEPVAPAESQVEPTVAPAEAAPPRVTTKRTIRGHSLRGLLEDGEEVTVDEHHFDDHAPQQEDIAIVQWAGRKNPLAKVVRGVAGDRFALQSDGETWSIEVNGTALKTTNGTPYAFSERASRMLRLYEHDYKGVIPPNTVLLLGNDPGGSTDATAFGLVDRSSLVGKVITKDTSVSTPSVSP